MRGRTPVGPHAGHEASQLGFWHQIRNNLSGGEKDGIARWYSLNVILVVLVLPRVPCICISLSLLVSDSLMILKFDNTSVCAVCRAVRCRAVWCGAVRSG